MPKTITIAGETFEISTPYEAGHQLTEAEARALNQVRAENIRNNAATMVKKARDEGTLDQARQKIADYDREYSFAMPGQGGGARVVRDPLEREARAIARDQIRIYLQKQNRKIKDVDPEKLEARIAEVAARDDVMKIARQRVKAKQSLGESLLDGVELDA